jgi:hypothetical protein
MPSNQVGLVQHGLTKMVFEFFVRPDLRPDAPAEQQAAVRSTPPVGQVLDETR